MGGLDVNDDRSNDEIFVEWAERTRNVIEECAGEAPKQLRLKDWFADPRRIMRRREGK